VCRWFNSAPGHHDFNHLRYQRHRFSKACRRVFELGSFWSGAATGACSFGGMSMFGTPLSVRREAGFVVIAALMVGPLLPQDDLCRRYCRDVLFLGCPIGRRQSRRHGGAAARSASSERDRRQQRSAFDHLNRSTSIASRLRRIAGVLFDRLQSGNRGASARFLELPVGGLPMRG
jgi:hypothetical protein